MPQAECEERFLDLIMQSAHGLPDEVLGEIRTEAKGKMHEMVTDKLQQLGDLSELRREELEMVLDRVLSSPDISQEIEHLVELMTNYAKSRLQNMT